MSATSAHSVIPTISFTPLPATGVIAVAGLEARSFLQGQLTNDVAAVNAGRAQLTGYCSPKGRLLAVAVLAQSGDEEFRLALPAELLAPTLKRLKMFLLRSKLTLTEASALSTVSVTGDGTFERLREQGFVLDPTPCSVAQQGSLLAITQPGAVPRVHLQGSAEALAVLAQSLALPMAPAEIEPLLDILAGRPQVFAETADQFVPQMIDLDRAGGVSFTKGCYPGQEIVARVHYLGRVKQRLFRAHSPSPLAAGSAVVTGAGGSAGAVVSSASAFDGGYSLLLSLHLDAAHEPLLAGEPATLLLDVQRVNAD